MTSPRSSACRQAATPPPRSLALAAMATAEEHPTMGDMSVAAALAVPVAGEA
jgi:hypothetical protein